MHDVARHAAEPDTRKDDEKVQAAETHQAQLIRRTRTTSIDIIDMAAGVFLLPSPRLENLEQAKRRFLGRRRIDRRGK